MLLSVLGQRRKTSYRGGSFLPQHWSGKLQPRSVNSHLPLVLFVLWLSFVTQPLWAQAADYEQVIAESIQAMRQEKYDLAEQKLEIAIRLAPKQEAAYRLRASLAVRQENHTQAIKDLTTLISMMPERADLYDLRGSENFKAGNIEASVSDFEKAVELEPARGPGHWQRGISYYYAGKFKQGIKQFEGYQTVDDSDVENAVWRFLCMAQAEDFQTSRKNLLKIGEDRRVPMRQIYDLFAGKATEEEVLAAARAGDPSEETLNRRLFYAYQYLGLYAEAQGKPQQSLQYTEAAVKHKISHYMWDVANVHLQLRKQAAEQSKME